MRNARYTLAVVAVAVMALCCRQEQPPKSIGPPPPVVAPANVEPVEFRSNSDLGTDSLGCQDCWYTPYVAYHFAPDLTDPDEHVDQCVNAVVAFREGTCRDCCETLFGCPSDGFNDCFYGTCKGMSLVGEYICLERFEE